MENQINRKKIKIEFEILKDKVELTWQDVLYAFMQKRIDCDFVIEYAIYVAENTKINYPDFLLNLLLLKSPYIKQDIKKILHLAIKQEKIIPESILKNRLLYITLLNISHKKLCCKDLERILAYEFSEFNYPDKMRSLVHYLPSSTPVKQQGTSWEEKLKDNLQNYLGQENPFN